VNEVGSMLQKEFIVTFKIVLVFECIDWE